MSDENEKSGSLAVDDTDQQHKGDEILKLMKQGADFTQEVLKENERLRYTAAKLTEDNKKLMALNSSAGVGGDCGTEVELYRTKVTELEKEIENIAVRFKEVETENVDFVQRYIEIENQNNTLANLYIASYQLHSTLDYEEVVRIILEIVINLVGGEKFAVYLIKQDAKELQPIASEGFDGTPPVIGLDTRVGELVRAQENYFRESMNPAEELDMLDPLVCVPMVIKEDVIGAIVMYKLFQQKEEFAELDFEMFGMLAAHAATAIFSSKMYSDSERKRSTMQGFIDLLTK